MAVCWAEQPLRSGQGRVSGGDCGDGEREVCEGDDDLKRLFGEDSLGIFLFSLIAIC